MRRRFILLISVVLVLAGCSPKSEQDPRPLAVCTTGMITDLVSTIGGDSIRVVGLMGPGVDPHYFKASQGDMEWLAQADMIFYNGLFLEGKMEHIFEKMASRKIVVAVSRDVPDSLLSKPAEFAGHFDPHIWFGVSIWQHTIPVVLEILSARIPGASSYFSTNAERYLLALDTLHLDIRRQLQSIPKERRILVTAHDAFGYFGIAYDVEVIGLQGISTVADFGVNDIDRVVNIIVERRVKSIFVESSISPKSIEAVRAGCLARGFEVSIGGTLYSDAMGGPGSGAETYITMVQANVSTIVSKLK